MSGFLPFLLREYRLSLVRLGDHLTQAAFFRDDSHFISARGGALT
jgi:hypothetical protein